MQKGNTALIIAARNGSVAIVLTLLSSSASVDNVNHVSLGTCTYYSNALDMALLDISYMHALCHYKCGYFYM